MTRHRNHFRKSGWRRQFVLGALCLMVPLALRAAESAWFEKVLVGMEVGPTGAQLGGEKASPEYARQFHGGDIVRRSVEANAEYLVIWARDSEFAYYDSGHLPKPAGLGNRDVLRETMQAAALHDLPIIAYCQLQYPARELREHPDWKAVDSEGKPIDHLMCFHSPYRDHVKLLLKEMMAYGIDGFHLDMVDQGFGPPHGCWCDRCRDLFESEFGLPMPDQKAWGETAWNRMLEFRYRTSDRFERELVDFIRAEDPSVTVDFNYHGNPPFSWEVGQTPVRHAGNGDFVTGEAGLWAFGALTASFNAEWYRAATPGKPFQVAVQRGVRMYHDQTTRPLHDMRWEMFTLLAHGAFVTMIDKTAYDGWLDPVAYERIGRVLGEARDKRDHFGHRPVREVGIFFSAKTRDHWGRDEAARYFQSVQGIHRMCVMEHLGFGFLFDEDLSAEALEAFPSVVIPNAAVLNDREIELFQRYVLNGGNLLITGHSGQFDALGNPLPSSALEALIGARMVKRLPGSDNWMRISRPTEDQAPVLSTLMESVPFDWPMLMTGPATAYEPTSAASFGELLDSDRKHLPEPDRYNPDWPLSAGDVAGPAVLLNAMGEGSVMTLAGSPGSAIGGEHAMAEVRRFMANAVRFLNPPPRVHIEAPSNVEAVVTDDPERRLLRVHLIAYNPTPRSTPANNRPHVIPGLIVDRPLFRAVLTPSDPVKDVSAWNESTRISRVENRIELMVEDIHEVVQLRY